MTAREVTLVLGMHRSGTSAVTGLLVRCGLQPPKTLIPADERNSEGYWESSVFIHFHERLLRAAGTRWESYTRIDPDWYESEAAAMLREECRALLTEEFGAATRFVLKDPRICRLLPFWLQVLEAEDIRASAVLVLRHPFEVAASLAARDGLLRRVSLLVWLRHVLEAETTTRSMRRSVIRYPDVLNDWRGAANRLAEDLGAPWSGHWDADEKAIDKFLRQGLRHHRGEDDAPDTPSLLAGWVERTWAGLSALAERDAQHTLIALGVLDAVHADFDRAVAVFGEDAEKQLLQALDSSRALESEVSALRMNLDNVSAERVVLFDQLAELQAQVNGLRAEVVGLQKHVAGLEAERGALRSSMSWRVTAPLRALFRIVR